MNRYKSILYVLLIFTLSCSSFIKDEHVSEINLLEKGTYAMINDVKVGGKSLKKGDNVMIIITHDNEWIKAEAYLSLSGKLKGERVRLVYMFEDDFPDEKFNIELFKKELFRFISVKTNRNKQ